MKTRKSYDTRIKYLVRQGLLPDFYRKNIHRSLISKWKRESAEKYTGFELNGDMAELYELMKKVSDDQQVQKALRSYYRINKVLRDTIGSGREYVKKLSENKSRIVNAIHESRKAIGLKRSLQLFRIGRSTYRVWAMEVLFRCGYSVSRLCNSVYPQQLTIKEVHKMHRLLSDEKFLHWPVISLAHYGIRTGKITAHPNTWYKYARLMEVQRRQLRKFYRVYDDAPRASEPNEKWHADITQFETGDGKRSYIYLVVDNFSRYIISWRIAENISAKIRLETFEESIHKSGILRKLEKKPCTELIVDGGTENNNKQVETFMERYPVEKLVALKDILHSNALVESVNKILKYDYLYPKPISNHSQLIRYFEEFIIPDYNRKRPHGALNGLTPEEAYKRKKVNMEQIRLKMKQALKERVCFNRKNECPGCPFGCKSG
jgi:putative transposase